MAAHFNTLDISVDSIIINMANKVAVTYQTPFSVHNSTKERKVAAMRKCVRGDTIDVP